MTNQAILKPIVSEKSIKDQEKGIYTFLVSRFSTKSQIKEDLRKVFDVDAAKVRTVSIVERKRMRSGGKPRTVQKLLKKAIVKLKEGQKIKLFEEKKGGKKKK